MTFDTELFIISIEQKKSIWNTSCTDYRDRDMKLKDWEDVGETMKHNFKEFTRNQKDDYIKELQKKWKSLRDAFRKEYTNYDKSGSQASKKSKYCYFDALSFLTPTFTVRQTSGNIPLFSHENTMDMVDENPTEVSPDIGIEDSNDNPSHDLTTQISTPVVNTPSISGTKRITNRKNSDSPSLFQQKLLKALDKSMKEDDDDDKYFLLSLLPGMKEIDNESKMDARIELMQVVQKYAKKRPTETATSPYCLPIQPIQYSSSIPAALNTAHNYGLHTPESAGSSNNWPPHY